MLHLIRQGLIFIKFCILYERLNSFTTLFYDTNEKCPFTVLAPLEKWRRRFGKVLLESDFLL